MRRIGVTYKPKHDRWLDGMLGMLDCGWWWPMRGAIVFSERPVALHRDAQTRLHNTRGMAIEYADGWGFHAVHGVRVPEHIITEPEKLTVEQILAESNAEVRRVMIELMPGGWMGFAESADLKLIDECPDPANEPNVIRLYELPKGIRDVLGTPVRLITCRNATPERDGTVRDFGLTVPVEMKRAIDAVAWTFGTDAEHYKELARAT